MHPNDVVIFNAPRGYDRGRIEFRINYVYTKRCIGAPGDSISIREGYFHNNRHTAPIGNLDQQRRLNRTPDSLIPRKVLRTIPFDDRNFGWTIRNMGPLYVPQAGVRVRLDSLNWKLYRQVIEYETGAKLKYADGILRLDGNPLAEYTFRQNYYFFCGDNVSDSKDSRYLGFVPEEFIIGVVRRISYSEEPYTGRKRPDRWWKRVDARPGRLSPPHRPPERPSPAGLSPVLSGCGLAAPAEWPLPIPGTAHVNNSTPWPPSDRRYRNRPEHLRSRRRSGTRSCPPSPAASGRHSSTRRRPAPSPRRRA